MRGAGFGKLVAHVLRNGFLIADGHGLQDFSLRGGGVDFQQAFQIQTEAFQLQFKAARGVRADQNNACPVGDKSGNIKAAAVLAALVIEASRIVKALNFLDFRVKTDEISVLKRKVGRYRHANFPRYGCGRLVLKDSPAKNDQRAFSRERLFGGKNNALQSHLSLVGQVQNMLLLTGEEGLPLNIEHSGRQRQQEKRNKRGGIPTAPEAQKQERQNRQHSGQQNFRGQDKAITDQNTGHQGDQRIP